MFKLCIQSIHILMYLWVLHVIVNWLFCCRRTKITLLRQVVGLSFAFSSFELSSQSFATRSAILIPHTCSMTSSGCLFCFVFVFRLWLVCVSSLTCRSESSSASSTSESEMTRRKPSTTPDVSSSACSSSCLLPSCQPSLPVSVTSLLSGF